MLKTKTSKGTKTALEPLSDMTETSEFTGWKFKIKIISMLRNLILKVDNMEG